MAGLFHQRHRPSHRLQEAARPYPEPDSRTGPSKPEGRGSQLSAEAEAAAPYESFPPDLLAALVYQVRLDLEASPVSDAPRVQAHHLQGRRLECCFSPPPQEAEPHVAEF